MCAQRAPVRHARGAPHPFFAPAAPITAHKCQTRPTTQRIKDMYVAEFPELGDKNLGFRWRSPPEAGKPWSLTYNLVLMIVIIDSFAASAGVFFLFCWLQPAYFPGVPLYHVPEIVTLLLGIYVQERFFCYHLPMAKPAPLFANEGVLFSSATQDGYLSFLLDPSKRGREAAAAEGASPSATPQGSGGSGGSGGGGGGGGGEAAGAQGAGAREKARCSTITRSASTKKRTPEKAGSGGYGY